MVHGDPTDFLGDFNQRAVAVLAPRGLSLCHKVPLLAKIPCGSMAVPMLLGEYPKGIPFLYTERKKGI